MLVHKEKAMIGLQDILAAYESLDDTGKEQFDVLRDRRLGKAEFTMLQRFALPTTVRSKSQFLAKDQTVESVSTGINAVGIYNRSSILDHACRPNATGNHNDDGTRKYYAHTSIVAGRKTTFSHHACPWLSRTACQTSTSYAR
nr:hypothetical protein B0A51_08332 [Rachicladosporium sp. CCFEE 5018]